MFTADFIFGILRPAVLTALTAVAVGAWRWLAAQTLKVKWDLIRADVQAVVGWAEQRFEDNSARYDEALEKLRGKYPGLAIDLLEVLIEAAVQGLTQANAPKTVVTVPLPAMPPPVPLAPLPDGAVVPVALGSMRDGAVVPVALAGPLPNP